MVACARSEIVQDGEVAVYHVWTRCVRRAFICGTDAVTGRDFNHRREWIRTFEEKLAGLVGLEIAFHAEMSNHLHLVVRSRPDIVDTWSDEEVVRRWYVINRLVKSSDGQTSRPVQDQDVQFTCGDREKVVKIRSQLSSVSYFMKALCEHIGRRANREDDCTGRFFEGRFHCRQLLDESAILVCGIYVDLNQIRAAEAQTPEESTHTSAFDRIAALAAADRKERESVETLPLTSNSHPGAPDGWMCPLTLAAGGDVDVRDYNRTESHRRASEKGILPISLPHYLQLLDWSGRCVRSGKAGSIPPDLAPILDRLGINTSLWNELVHQFDRWFGAIVGTAVGVAERAMQAGRQRFMGTKRCAEVFG